MGGQWLGRAPLAGFLLQLPHRFAEELGVEVEADILDVAALGRAQDVAGAPYLQVPHGDAESGPQLRSLQDCLETVLRCLSDAASRWGHQVGVGPVLAPAYPAP